MGEDQLSLSSLLKKALRSWYLYALALMAAFSGAYYYLQITPPKYQANALLQVRSEKDSRQVTEEAIFNELGLGKQKANLDDEMLILTSVALMEQVVKDLGLNYRFFRKEGLKEEEVYHDVPVRVLSWRPKKEKMTLEGELKLDKAGGYSLTVEEKKFEGRFGERLMLPWGELVLMDTAAVRATGSLSIMLMPTRGMASYLTSSMEVKLASKNASSLSLSLRDGAQGRARDVLFQLIARYNQRSVEEKNEVYENTINLIDQRVARVYDELAEVEQEVEAYKRRFNLTEVQAEGSLLLNELASFNKEASGVQIQMDILNTIEDFLEQHRNSFEFVPTNLTINNLTLTNQINSFNTLLVQREQYRIDKGPAHPEFLLTERQIQTLRENIIDNIRTIKADLKVTQQSKQGMQANLESRLKSLPSRERELVEIQRQKVVKENLYLYLLQKKEESVISLAIATNRGSLVDLSESSKPVSPVRAQIWLIALFLGMAVPSGLVLLRETLNDKISSEEEIGRLTNVPVVGTLALSKGKKLRAVVKENSHSAASELFRMLRTNLAYVVPGQDLKNVMITSSISGEGKSFISLNLGLTQAVAGKKVVLVNLDLRKVKPQQNGNGKENGNGKGHGNGNGHGHGSLNGHSPREGVVNYLIDPSISIERIIRRSEEHPNLDLIETGPKPPNPGELILSSRLRQLVAELRERYDFVVLDTPPVGLVADSLQMRDLVEATLYVVRSGYTSKENLKIIDDIAQKDKLPRPFIILNGVRLNHLSTYGGYGRGYGKGYGYYTKD